MLFGMWGKSIKKLKPKSKPAQSIKIKLFLYVACVEHRGTIISGFSQRQQQQAKQQQQQAVPPLGTVFQITHKSIMANSINTKFGISIRGNVFQLETCAIVFITNSSRFVFFRLLAFYFATTGKGKRRIYYEFDQQLERTKIKER